LVRLCERRSPGTVLPVQRRMVFPARHRPDDAESRATN
jgi:hypothetical protein